MNTLPLIARGVAGNRTMRICARRPDRHSSVANVKYISLYRRDHHVLSHELQLGQSAFHFLKIVRGHRRVSLIGQPDLVSVRNSHGISLPATMRNYWPVMGVFYLDSSLLH